MPNANDVSLTTTLTLETKLRLKILSTMLNRNQGQIITDALARFVEQELTPEQRSVVEDMIRHSKPEDETTKDTAANRATAS
jgi:hypothetical protein